MPFERRRHHLKIWYKVVITNKCAAVCIFMQTVKNVQSLSKPRSIGDLTQHFRKSGIDGKYSVLPANMLIGGATEGGLYEGNAPGNVKLLILAFGDQDKAADLEKTGYDGHKCYHNGNLGIVVFGGDEAKIAACLKKL